MRGTLFMLTTLLLSVFLADSDGFAQKLQPPFTPIEQFLVLKNGEVLRGQITRNAAQVILLTEQGSRLVLPEDQTDFICDSMDEAYWGKVARTKATDLNGQKKLFHWCLKNKLVGQAQNQIEILLLSNLKAVELEYLNRQLNVAILQQRDFNQRGKANSLQSKALELAADDKPKTRLGDSNQSLALTPIELDRTIGVKSLGNGSRDRIAFRPLPKMIDQNIQQEDLQFIGLPPLKDSNNDDYPGAMVRQVGFEEAVDVNSDSLNDNNPSLGNTADSSVDLVDDRMRISIHELDREIRSLPAGTVGHFRRRIEHILVNGCSAANCHDMDSKIMPLNRSGRSRQTSGRQSQWNLHNVIRYVDRAHPIDSRLLTAMTSSHAGSHEPLIEKGSPQYTKLLNWLISLSDDPQQAAMEAIRRAQETKKEAEQHRVEPVEPERVGLFPIKGSSLEFPDTIGEIPKLDAVETEFTPIDPFDPEIFNRKFDK